MKQVIIIFIKNKNIDKIRKRYDPFYRKFKTHISIVYAFENIDQNKLNKHIKESIKNIKSFRIQLKGLKKSTKDYYLYLLINKNKNKIIEIYKKLNSGILKGFKNKDMPKYIPHITLGVFNFKKDIDDAIHEIKKENLKENYLIKEISLLTINDNNSIKSIKKFKVK